MDTYQIDYYVTHLHNAFEQHNGINVNVEIGGVFRLGCVHFGPVVCSGYTCLYWMFQSVVIIVLYFVMTNEMFVFDLGIIFKRNDVINGMLMINSIKHGRVLVPRWNKSCMQPSLL